MKSILKVIFNTGPFDSFRIENPGHIPVQGEIFDCKWDDFTEDNELLEFLRYIEEEKEDFWRVERHFSTYSKDESVCNIVLYLSDDYDRYFKNK